MKILFNIKFIIILSFLYSVFLHSYQENTPKSLFYLANNNIDTIPFWHIYLNKQKIHEFNLTSKKTTLELRYSQNDTLKVHYYSDVYCTNCHKKALIKDSKGNILLQLQVNHQNYFKSYSLPLKLLFKRKEETFDFFLTRPSLQENYLFSLKFR